ncbi:hypothetical protein [Dokdonella sp.]|uniref:hypothetical protein n=1 Tax=Dokdonella sp. TaxID=2291710 RepID=UPI003526F60D
MPSQRQTEANILGYQLDKDLELGHAAPHYEVRAPKRRGDRQLHQAAAQPSNSSSCANSASFLAEAVLRPTRKTLIG